MTKSAAAIWRLVTVTQRAANPCDAPARHRRIPCTRFLWRAARTGVPVRCPRGWLAVAGPALGPGRSASIW